MKNNINNLMNIKYGDYSVSKIIYNYVSKLNKIEDLEKYFSDFYEIFLPNNFNALLGDTLYKNLIFNIQNSILDLIDKQGVKSKDIILSNIKNEDKRIGVEFIFNLISDKMNLDSKEDFIDLIFLKEQYWSQLLKDIFSPSLERLYSDRELERVKLAKETLKLLNIFSTKEK